MLEDVGADASLGDHLTAFLVEGGSVGCVGHGVAALLHAMDRGEPLVAGKEVRRWGRRACVRV